MAACAQPRHDLGSGRKQLEALEVSIEDGKFLQLFTAEFHRDVRAVRLELRGLGGHFHLLAGRADLELAIDLGAGVGGHLNVFVFQALETRALDPDRVDVRDQVRHRIVATLIRGDFAGDILRLARDCNLRPRVPLPQTGPSPCQECCRKRLDRVPQAPTECTVD